MHLIAEIGWNHMGDLELAERMIKAAAEAGATHAKFQTWHERNLKPGPWDTDGRREIYVKAELSVEQFKQLKGMCEAAGVTFMTSLFSLSDVEDMAAVDSSCIKIPSPEIANVELLRAVASRFQRIFMSTGAATEQEIDQALGILKSEGAEVIVMHCVSMYPCPDEKVNLPRIDALQAKHDLVGFSDHTPDHVSALFAMQKGVVAIEKHFTLDNDLPGRDNKFALLPEAFAEMTAAARRFAAMNTDLGIEYLPEEQEVRDVYRGRWG